MVDMLGCPVTVGCTVLTTGYGTSVFDTIIAVDKVNRKSISITLKVTYWTHNHAINEYESTHQCKTVRRTSSQVIVIDQQLAYIQEHFPENLI